MISRFIASTLVPHTYPLVRGQMERKVSNIPFPQRSLFQVPKRSFTNWQEYKKEVKEDFKANFPAAAGLFLAMIFLQSGSKPPANETKPTQETSTKTKE